MRAGKELKVYNDRRRNWVSIKHGLAKKARMQRESMGQPAKLTRENEGIHA